MRRNITQRSLALMVQKSLLHTAESLPLKCSKEDTAFLSSSLFFCAYRVLNRFAPGLVFHSSSFRDRRFSTIAIRALVGRTVRKHRWFGFFTWLCLVVATVYWLFRAVRVVCHLIQFIEIRAFYVHALHISASDLDNMTWHEVQRRVLEVQKDQQMCIHKQELTELVRVLFYQALFTSVVSSECLLILRCYVVAKKVPERPQVRKRRKAWNKGQTTAAAVPVAVPDGACSSSVTEPLLRPFADCCEAESVESATSSYVRPPDAVDRDGRSREPDCGGTASAAVATPGVRASNILSRVSAQIPSSEEIAQRAQTRRDVLDAVASKSASKRKLELLNEGCDENDGGKDSTFFIVNKKMLNGLLSSVKCNKCDEGSIRLETTHCLGLAARMGLFCDNCGIVNSACFEGCAVSWQKTICHK
ncbi:hypothetical protein HPB51_007575 [Rhipicephalus microplus]|uniref:Autophagy-related protein 9 n=1 Tax=Rhipicephalus microplus TaxID=6941 RepID=A0A9J6D4Z0_RHIMP|nr:hypothetical protein HPB51_007575 [Rhipicephalus microplus]